jgi:hypothetical protein
MHSGTLAAFILSTTGRRQVREGTIASLAASDWGSPPTVVLDQQRYSSPGARMVDNARTLLLRAVAGGAELVLFLEDDVEVNPHIRYNLEHWPPLRTWRPGQHLFASLYDPNVGSLDPGADGPTWRIVDPDLAYGSQALLLSRATVRWILQRWDDLPGLHDTRMPQLAARVTPVLYHRPSLVQHRQVPSVWGGVPHAAADFDPTWRTSA